MWVAREDAIYWVDILRKAVHRLGLANGAQRSWTFQEQVTSLAPRQQGGFVASICDGFAFVDFETEAVEPIVLPERFLQDNRFNDGKVDAWGRFWAGSMDDTERQTSGALYRLDPDGTLHTMDRGYFITNGPTFSPDGTTLYHTDTTRREVYAFDFDGESGQISNKRLFIALQTPQEGSPDGMTVDRDGNLWLCHFGGARISCYAPSGDIIEVIPMPVPNVTSCTFAGPDLDTLYITTARILLDDDTLRRHPLAGSLFRCKPGTTGLPTQAFGG